MHIPEDDWSLVGNLKRTKGTVIILVLGMWLYLYLISRSQVRKVFLVYPKDCEGTIIFRFSKTP